MYLRKVVLAFCVVGAMCSLAHGQVKFQRKYKEGSSRTVEVSTNLEQTLVIAGMNTETASETKMTVTANIGKRDSAGQLRIDEIIDAMQISTKVMGSEYAFDSSNPDKVGSSPLEILRPVHKALAGRKTTTVYNKNNEVAMIEFDQNLLNNVPEQVRGLVKGQLDPEQMKRTANDELQKLPADPVKAGDSWERSTKMNLGAGQIMTSNTKYTYEGEKEKNGKKLDKITFKTTSVDFGLEDSPLPLTVKSSDLKPAESEGELWFDREAGEVVEQTSMVRIKGDITFVINNNDVPSQLDLKIQSSTLPKAQ